MIGILINYLMHPKKIKNQDIKAPATGFSEIKY